MEKAIEKETVICATCRAACPAYTDTRTYAHLISEGRYEEAMEVLLEANPFSSVCGLICHHPCELDCRRVDVDEGVGLRDLKRFVMEQTREYRKNRVKKIEPTRSEKVAVIGAGPAGLTAAADLARAGFPVTVFEKSDRPGGMLTGAIPPYRLPLSVVMEDIDDITGLGVELRTSVEVGKDVTLESLKADGYKAIVASTGLPESRGLNIPGIDSTGIHYAIPFLWTVTRSDAPKLGSRMIVIGGGNVAADVARSARRFGVPKVTMVSLENRDEMPAWAWEIQECEEEGVEIMNSWGPKAVLAESGKVKGLEFKRCTRVFDEQGRFSPEYDEGELTTVEADDVVLAIGQGANLTFLEGADVKTSGPGRIEWDPKTLATSREGLFACGEVVTGPGAAMEAVASGHRVAEAVKHFLDTGQILHQPVPERAALGKLPEDTRGTIPKRSREWTEPPPGGERVKNFDAYEPVLSEAAALAEARRCMSCGLGAVVEDESKCALCLTCVRVCPFGVATIEKTAAAAVMSAEECQACGLCAAFCPANAIHIERYETNRMKEVLRERIAALPQGKRAESLVVSFGCLLATTSRALIQEAKRTDAEILQVLVPCVARLSVSDFLAPFELGAAGLLVLGCDKDACVYPTAEGRLKRHLDRAREVLKAAGVGAEAIDHRRTEGSAEASWPRFFEEAKERFRKGAD
ncbi:MAG: FAD-dependent oxidoreductase [Planctomycetota bacterium]|jgi:NADPH-dependent glutamate synthase beta subunit-like oxidoreductase/coenzyme F420-reducing hydrogenase delta subunit